MKLLLTILSCLFSFNCSLRLTSTRYFRLRNSQLHATIEEPLMEESNAVKNPPTARNPSTGLYDTQQFKKAFISQPEEFEYYIDIDHIEGQIPLDFEGSLFRNRPALFERGEHHYGHYLDGDGYITRISFSKGKAHFMSKFVRTDEYVQESEEGEVLFRSTFRTQRKKSETYIFGCKIDVNNAFDLKLKNPSNTNIVPWGGKLLSYFEAGVPHRIDPISLNTIGVDNMNIDLKSGLPVFIEKLESQFPEIHSQLCGSFATAHPKFDFKKNRMVSWITSAVEGEGGMLDTHPWLRIYEWDEKFQPQGPPVKYVLNSTAIAPHDFSITENYYVFVENRAGGDTMPYLLGTKHPAECMSLAPLEPMILHLVPRLKDQPHTIDTSMDPIGTVPKGTIRVELEPGFTIHSVCAFEVENTVELYTTAWECSAVSSGSVKGGLLGAWEGAAPNFDSIPLTLLYRSTVDLKTGKLLSHRPVSTMERTIIEHPHGNPEYEGSPMRYIFMSLCGDEGVSSPPVGYLRLDLVTGNKQEWYAPLHTFCEEVVVVPKVKGENYPNVDQICDEKMNIISGKNTGTSGSKGASKEDNVWVVASMFDAVSNRACVGIFDGNDLSKGPVATVWMTHPLPHSLHGSFAPDLYVSL
mmetsp:Transcript_24254/g.23310  ORF Transcript_24254/g.23310 Transcript_24254/m.23310 type:complete len:637 (-) Transcript_24254:150-2060(-)